MIGSFLFRCRRAGALSWCGLFVSGCFIELDEVKGPILVDASGGSGGGVVPAGGGMGGEPGDGGSPAGGGVQGGTGGTPDPVYGPNLIVNGDFSSGTTGWDNGGLNQLEPPPLMDGMGCTSDGGHTNPPDQFIGWSGDSGGTTLEAGTYRYEFTLRSIGATNVEIKIASTVPPEFEPWLLRTQISPPADSQNVYEYEFVVTSEQTQIGLLFNAKNGEGQICVDDVSLRKQL